MTPEERASFEEASMVLTAKRAPYRKSPSGSGRISKEMEGDPLTESDEFQALDPSHQKQVRKLLNGMSVDKLYNICLGLPSRVRSFVKKCWKRQEKWEEPWEKVAHEMAPQASKILNQRMDIVTLFGFVARREGLAISEADEKVLRMSEAMAETDALLILYSFMFTIGVTSAIGRQAHNYLMRDAEEREYLLGGIIDVIDFGAIDPARRKQRQASSMSLLREHGWKLPERDF